MELVLEFQPAPDADMAQLFRDDDMWAASVEATAPFLHPDFECVGTLFGTEKIYTGTEGFRAFFLDWLAPWASYRVEVEKAIDFGERVLAVYRAFGRLEGSTQEVESTVAWVWTVRDGRVVRINGFSDEATALEAVGLME